MAHRILLIDDEEDILAVTSEYLQAQGYEVDCAQEREEAERRKGAKKCVCAYLFRSASEFHFFSRTAETSSF